MNNLLRLLKQTIGNHKTKFFLLNLLSLISILADMISLGSLTAYISFVFDKQILIETVDKYNLENFSILLNKNDSLIFLTLILIVVFILKNLFIFFVIFFEINFIKDIRIEKTKLLFNDICLLYQSPVYLILKNEKYHEIEFTSLQSDISKEILSKTAYIKIMPTVLFFYLEFN